MRRAKSQAQLQREYRDRLKRKDPELLRARDHEKYRRRCLKRKMLTTAIHNFDQRNTHANVSVRGIKQADGAMSPFVEAPLRDGASTANIELKQYEISARLDNMRNTDASNARKLYPIEETTYRNYNQHVDIARTHENRSMTEQSVANRLRNSPTTEVSVKCPIHDLLRWLENAEVDDNVKYGFLKYVYNEKRTTIESPSACNNGSTDAYTSFIHQNSGSAEGERQDLRKRHDTPNRVQLYYTDDKKRIPMKSSSEPGVLPKHTQHENAERRATPLHRKSAKKIRNKVKSKKTTNRKNMDVKQRKHITWEPLCFDIDDNEENDDRSAYRFDA